MDALNTLTARYIGNHRCNNRYGYSRNCNSAWDRWGRWVALAVIIVFAIAVFYIVSCISARNRRRRGLQPFRGTGWAGTWGNQQHMQPQHGQAQQGFYPPYNSGPPPGNAPPPQYSPAGGYYGNDNNNNNPQGDPEAVPLQAGSTFNPYPGPPPPPPNHPNQSNYPNYPNYPQQHEK